MKQRLVPFALALMLGISVAAGCSENKVPTAADTAATEQKKIDDIQNDPNLPPAAKESILRNMKQQQTAAQAKGQASGAGAGSSAPK